MHPYNASALPLPKEIFQFENRIYYSVISIFARLLTPPRMTKEIKICHFSINHFEFLTQCIDTIFFKVVLSRPAIHIFQSVYAQEAPTIYFNTFVWEDWLSPVTATIEKRSFIRKVDITIVGNSFAF